MTSSEVRSFTEPSEFTAALCGTKMELCLLAPGPFAANYTRVDLNSLRIHKLSGSHPCILHATNTSGRAVISFSTEPGSIVFRSGIEMPPNSIVSIARYQSYFQRSSGPLRWGGMSIPVDDLRSAGMANGCDLTPPSTEQISIPPPAAVAKLQHLHRAVGTLAEATPNVLDHPEVARALEQTLLQAMVQCLRKDDVYHGTDAHRRHDRIMLRFHRVLESQADQPLYILELARAMGVSVRTLSICCQEYLGMGPKKYLTLRRMTLARQALHMADPDVTSVTDIATRYGFWQFGRFAVEYKRLFAESPSSTLNREPS